MKGPGKVAGAFCQRASASLAGPESAYSTVGTDSTGYRAGRLEMTRERVELAVPVHHQRHVAHAAQRERTNRRRRQPWAGHDAGEAAIHVVHAPAAADRAVAELEL